MEQEREAILAAILERVPFEGWTESTLAQATKDAGFDAAIAAIAFPGGPIDVIDYFVAEADRQMVESLESYHLEKMKVPERIRTALLLRLEQHQNHKEAVRKALAVQMLPQHASHAISSLYHTVDTVWRAAGDDSVDFNFYTKRLTLAGVYSSTLLFWLDDDSTGHEATRAFLDRRLIDVMHIGKARGKLEALGMSFISKLKQPFSV